MRTTIFHFSAATLAFVTTTAVAWGQSDTSLHSTAMVGWHTDTTAQQWTKSVPTAGEQHEAPYMDRDGGPRGAGTVVGTAEVSGVIEASERELYELGEDVYITLPPGTTAAIGDRFFTFALDTSFGRRGQIVVPTGVVQVVRPAAKPEATIARIVQEFSNISLHQGLLPLTTAPAVGVLAPVENGLISHVLWVSDDAVLPGLQYYVVLSAGEKEGVHPGDRFTLYRPATQLPESSIVLPPADVAVAEVVHVNAYGSSAIVIKQMQPAIHAGGAARLTARAP